MFVSAALGVYTWTLGLWPLSLSAGLVGVYLCTRWYRRPSHTGAALLTELDRHDPDLSVYGVSTPYQRELAFEFKAEFGELRYNNANRRIASDYVLKAMSNNKDLRNCDRVRLYPLTVELCLLPTRDAVTAANLARTLEVRARRSAVDCCR